MRAGIALLVIGGLWLLWIVAFAGYPTLLPFIMTGIGALIVLTCIFRNKTKADRSLSSCTKNILGFIAWGSLASLVMFFMMTTSVAMIMGRHRIHLPDIIISFMDAIYLAVGFPAMWIRPGTIFDNFAFTFLSIFIFWGAVLQGILIVYQKRRSPT